MYVWYAETDASNLMCQYGQNLHGNLSFLLPEMLYIYPPRNKFKLKIQILYFIQVLLNIFIYYKIL